MILGGVQIPFAKGLLGHSDADALLHAITDALFGAAAMGDIGTDFPDTDAAFKGADTLALLREAARLVRSQGYTIGNVDSTVIAQAPKLAPHIAAMRQNIAQALGINVDCVNVKAKTAEKMGPVGEGRAMEAEGGAGGAGGAGLGVGYAPLGVEAWSTVTSARPTRAAGSAGSEVNPAASQEP